MDEIDRASPLPLWAQLLAVLRERIAAGTYDESFPTDEQLAREFELSRHTVRESVRRLQEERLVSRRRGVGTSVRRRPVEQPYGALYSLFRSIEGQGREQRSDVLDLSVVTDEHVAVRLGLPASAELVRLERLRRVDGTPLAHDVAWMPAEIARPLLDVDFSHTALYDELATICRVHPDAGSEWIHPVVPDAIQRRLLRLPARSAAFWIERLTSARSRTIEWRESLVRADQYTFVAHWSPAVPYEPVLAPM